jgi:hypothetical protein
MMRLIYEQSRVTLVWLSPSTNDSDIAIETVLKLKAA